MITINYMKMCEKAKEIQKLWERPFKNYVGDFYWRGKKYLQIPSACAFVTEIMFVPKKNNIWLPTQEQLWGMLPEIKDKVHVVFRFNKFLSGKYINDSAHVAFVMLSNMPKEDEEDFSITELLFCFIMSEKYNKIWTGEKWEEIK